MVVLLTTEYSGFSKKSYHIKTIAKLVDIGQFALNWAVCERILESKAYSFQLARSCYNPYSMGFAFAI